MIKNFGMFVISWSNHRIVGGFGEL